VGIEETVFYGVVSGVITAAALYLFGLLINYVLLPKYRAFVYRGVNIQGKWDAGVTLEEDDDKDKFNLYLNQNAHELDGTLTLVQERKEGGIQSMTYNCQGETYDGFVVLSLRSTDPRNVGLASIVAKVTAGGKNMTGNMTFHNIINEEIRSIKVKFHRPF
jgi:hypothetical protein